MIRYIGKRHGCTDLNPVVSFGKSVEAQSSQIDEPFDPAHSASDDGGASTVGNGFGNIQHLLAFGD
jgi:hypothetical protein